MRLRAYQQLFLSYLSLIALLVLALSVGAGSLLRRNLIDVAEQQLVSELRVDVAFYEASPDLDPDSVSDLLGLETGHRVTIVRRDGRVVGESTLDGPALAAMESHADRPEVIAALAGGAGSSVRFSETVDAELLFVAMTTRGGEVLRVGVPLARIDAAVSQVRRGIYGIGAAAVLLATIFSLGFSILVTYPLRKVTAAAGALAAGNLSIRLRDRRGNELGDLARALDTLAEELQRRLFQLEGERAEMQALIDSMSEGVLALARDGTVRRANPAARRMFSLQDSANRIPPEAVTRKPEFLRLVRRALAGETVPLTELGGDGRSILATAHALPDGGAVLVFLDVSEIRRLEGVRRDFVANASHELKTPLTAIRGYSETLLDPDLPPELRHRFAEIVKQNADRLQHIVDDLLDLSRIEQGGWEITATEVDIAEMARQVWDSQPLPTDKASLELVLDVSDAAELARVDPGALRQIFSNLFSNAVRYTSDPGHVTVSTRPSYVPDLSVVLQIPTNGDGAWVRIEVRDTGSGIPSAHLPRIFERFYRVDPARSRIEGGTGLGLAIVKHLVEAHGGRINAESEVGEGTSICFTLPAIDKAAGVTRSLRNGDHPLL